MIWVTRIVKVTQSEHQKGKRIKKNKNRAHEVSQLLWQGKEQPWAGRPASRLLSTLLVHVHLAARVPQRKVSSASGLGRRSPRGELGGCQLNVLLPKWKQNHRRQQERMNLQIEKCKQKRKGEQRENRWKWPPKRLKIYLHQMERLKTRKERSYV